LGFSEKRRAMVEHQLRTRGIADERILAVMGGLPRESFVASGMVSRAYEDGALALAEGQTISQPYMVALMTQELRVRADSTVLEIGTGSGYQAAILAELAFHVYTIERIASLSERARKILGELGYDNVSFRVGDGSMGWPEPMDFDRIIVTAGAPRRPERLLENLMPGGILVAPVGPARSQDLMVYSKLPDGYVREKNVCQCIFVPLIGREGWAPGGQ